MKNKDSVANLALRLIIITVCAGLILGLVYGITKGPIGQQTEKQQNEARMQVLPTAKDFEEIDMTALNADMEMYGIIQQVYAGLADGQVVGYTMSVLTKGFSANLALTVGMDVSGSVTGVAINSHEETAGLGANATKPEFLGQFEGADGPLTVVKTPTGQTGEIQALTGATITSKGVTDAVNLAREFFEAYLKEGV